MSALAAARRKAILLAKRVLERSDDVLWTDALPGIVLHNLVTQRYLELGEVGYRAWSLLDGARPSQEVVDRLVAGAGDERGTVEREAWEIVSTLAENGFVTEARNG